MANLFEPERKFVLESKWRQKMLPPYEVLKKLGIKSTDTVADIGCGIGYFSIPASEYTDGNVVYALDLQDEMLEEIKRRIGSKNIIVVKNEPYDLRLSDESVDFAIMVTVIHEIDDKQRFLREVRRILKQDGRLAVVDWQKTDLNIGPPVSHKFSPEDLVAIFNDTFIHSKTIDFNEFFYGVIFTKG
ncbi:MAG TPA: class I SAM-dependent methyltransferase [Clostridia bacterium]|nr:class I SAM-dependent methyltransferase [Clostridia bacterium]